MSILDKPVPQRIDGAQGYRETGWERLFFAEIYGRRILKTGGEGRRGGRICIKN
jgi:hypothetical protein